MITRRFLGFIALFCAVCAYSQHRAPLKFETISAQDRLSNPRVNSYAQDSAGFVWVGTENGLNRYDGRSIKVFESENEDTTTLASSYIRKVYVDKKKRLWVVTSAGVSLYHPRTESFLNFFPRTHRGTVYYFDLIEDENGTILLLANDNHIFRYDETNLAFELSYIIDAKCQLDLFISHGSNLYTVCDNLLYTINLEDGQVLGEIELSSWSSSSYQTSDLEIIDNHLWVAGEGLVLHRINLSTNHVEEFYSRVVSVCPSAYGTVYLAGIPGIYEFNPENGEVEPIPYILDQGYLVNCNYLFLDNNETLWVANQNHGALYAHKSQRFYDARSLNSDFSETFQRILCMETTSDNKKMFLGDFSGAFYMIDLQTGKYDLLDIGGGNPLYPIDQSVFTIFEDSKSRVWIGTYKGGLKQINTEGRLIEKYLSSSSPQGVLGSNDIRAITEDAEGKLWLVEHGYGVERFDPETGKIIASYEADTYGRTKLAKWGNSIEITQDGVTWIGSNVGLSAIKGTEVKHFIHEKNKPGTLSSSSIHDLFVDEYGNLWIATQNGLNLYDPKDSTFRVFSEADGLADNYVTSFIDGLNRTLWIGTDNGLSLLSYSGDSSYIIQEIKLSNGKYSNQFLPRASARSSSRLFFSTNNGILFFDELSAIQPTHFGKPYFTSLKLFNREVEVCRSCEQETFFYLDKNINALEKLILAHDQNSITLEFGNINFDRHDDVQYYYRLEGLENEWVSTEAKLATYTLLPPGEYVFQLRTSMREDAHIRALPIIVQPPWYQTWWGLFIIIFVFIGLLIFAFILIMKWINLKNRSERERQVNDMKTKLFMNVSHEFRTPLTLIQGPLENMKNGLKDSVWGTQLELMDRNSKRLMRLVNQLLDMRKLETGTYHVCVEMSDIGLFVESIFRSFDYLATRHNIDYTFANEIKRSSNAWFDKDVLEKILYNLISNAFKYTSDNGEILLSLSHHQEEQWVRISVRDSGIGISKENIQLIFKRFVRVENPMVRKESGAGIGLSLTKEMVELHHGFIEVISEENQGTSFNVFLPVSESAYSQKEKLIDTSTNKTQYPHITADIAHSSMASVQEDVLDLWGKSDDEDKAVMLVVDDSEDLRTYVKSSLQNEYHVIEAENGRVGMEKALAMNPDIIISDVMMPEMNGLEFCAQIKQDIKLSHIPVILLTARSEEADLVQGLLTGADDYITKPFSIDVLQAKIRTTIENRKHLREKLTNSHLYSSVSSEHPDKIFLNKFYETISDNLSNSDVDSVMVARELGMSRSQLYNKVKAVTGKTVNELIKTYKLELAAQLLKEGSRSATEIAALIGYSEVANFSRAFKSFHGVSPRQYTAKKSS